jgi:hypothetical protein
MPTQYVVGVVLLSIYCGDGYVLDRDAGVDYAWPLPKTRTFA